MTERPLSAWPSWCLLLLAVAAALPACGETREAAPPEQAIPSAVAEPPGAADSAGSRVVLTEAAATAAGIRTEPARRADGTAVVTVVEAPGQVDADPSRTAFISPRAAGRLERLTRVVGDRVETGEAVAWIQSPAYTTAQSDFQQAARRAALLAGTADSTGAGALSRAAAARLRMFGVPDSAIARLADGGAPEVLLPVTAPFAGSLVEGMTLAGAAVEPGTPIFRIIDLTELDVVADVPERFLPGLRVGQSAIVLLAAYPDLRLEGHVERIRDELDPTTRTIEALVHVANRNRALRPGMFAKVQIRIAPADGASGSAGEAGLVLAASAVVSDADRRYVFVEVAPYTYERRAVELGGSDARFGGVGASEVVVKGGVLPGDRVVVEGAFTLKSELAKAGFAEEE